MSSPKEWAQVGYDYESGCLVIIHHSTQNRVLEIKTFYSMQEWII